MNLDAWLAAVVADARRRDLPQLAGLLEGLAQSTRALRDGGTAPLTEQQAPQPRRPGTRAHAATAAASPATIAEFGRRLRRGQTTAVETVRHCLERIDAWNGTLNAFILVTRETALQEAEHADRELAAGRDRGPLHGVPMSIKDLFDVAGTPTTAASHVRDGHRAVDDAPAIRQLRQAGAVIIGKTNLHEFAFGTTNEDSAYGPARHPLDHKRSPGGSSGGSAVSIVAEMALASLGTDTGGSIRIPAAACGLVGLKPTYGEISTSGVVPLSRTLDHAGPLAVTVTDAWDVFDALKGRAGQASRRVRRDTGDVRLAVPNQYFLDLLDDDVRGRFEAALDRLQSQGAAVTYCDIGHAPLIAPAYLHLVLGDAAEYHAATLEASPLSYTEPLRLRLEMARYVQAEDYVRALAVRERLRQEVDLVLSDVDALVLPTLPIPAPPLGAASAAVGDSTQPIRNLMLRLTQLFNLTGHPAVSLPCGHTPAGLPVGVQLVGGHAATDALLSVALAVEGTLMQA